MRQLFSFLGHSNFTFHLTNATEAKQASSLAVRPENTLGLGIGSRFRRCKQANVNRRMSSRKKKLLRRCLSLSLMAVGLSSTSALAGVVKLDGTSGSNQNSTAINTGSGTELQNGFFVDYLIVGGGGSGGSGGGAGSNSRLGGAAQAGQGNQGGNGGTGVGGGGGGAGAAGAPPGPFPSSAVGGAGKVSSITGSAVTYAGGGGAGMNSGFMGALGGAGGGGQGSGGGGVPVNGTNGLGGGGGGGGTQQGGNGGSGVVIVRYQGASLGAIGGSVTTGSGFTVHQFSAVGNSSFNMSGVDMNARLGVVQNGVISGAGDLSFSGPGQLTLNAANTHTGFTRALAGTLNLGHANALEYSTLDMNSANSGTVALTQSGQTYNVAGLQGSRDLAIGSNALSVGANNNSTTYSGNLSGTGGVSKVGNGTLNLSGTNAYTGTTDVAAGKLLVNGSTAGGAVTVQNSASLGGTGTLNGSTTFLSGSIHTPGNSPGLQTFTSGLTYNTGSTFEWELTSNTTTGRGTIFDAVNVSGNPLLIQSGVTSSLVFNGTGSTVDWTDAFWGFNQSWLVFSSAAGITAGSPFFDTINVTNDINGVSLATARATAFFSWSRSGNELILNYSAPVPEPASMAIFGLGALGFAYSARRKRLRE